MVNLGTGGGLIPNLVRRQIWRFIGATGWQTLYYYSLSMCGPWKLFFWA